VSQYPYPPNPYVPPNVDYSAWPVAPRRDRNAGAAALLQLLLGGFLFLAGTCFGGVLWTIGFDTIYSEMQKEGASIPDISGHDTKAIYRATVITVCVAMFLAGILLLALSLFVYRARKGPTLVSLLLVGIITMVLMFSIVSGLSELGPDPRLIIYVIGLLYCMATLVLQIQALRAAPDPRAQAAMQQAWYWMQQQQSAGGYGQGSGYGYGYPPPPPPAPPPPPSDSQNPPAPPTA